jgi:hypothetical protein
MFTWPEKVSVSDRCVGVDPSATGVYDEVEVAPLSPPKAGGDAVKDKPTKHPNTKIARIIRIRFVENIKPAPFSAFCLNAASAR